MAVSTSSMPPNRFATSAVCFLRGQPRNGPVGSAGEFPRFARVCPFCPDMVRGRAVEGSTGHSGNGAAAASDAGSG